MKLFFYVLIYSIPLSVSANALSLNYTVEREDALRDDKNYVIEREFKSQFDKPNFESSVKKVFEKLQTVASNNKFIEVDLNSCTQSKFVERYFKYNGYDAYLTNGVLKVYTQKIFHQSNEIF